MNKISVTNIKVTNLTPKINDPELIKLLPTVNIPDHMEFVLSGVDNSVSNAIRRTIACELLVSGLNITVDDIETNDEFIISEFITSRIKLIPIKQSCPLDAVFELYVENNTPVVMDVKTGQITIVNKGSPHPLKSIPFNETFTLLSIQPGKSIRIKNIRVMQNYCKKDTFGGYAVASNVTSVAQDQIPINMYEPDSKGIPSSVSNPQVWKISYNTNGTIPAKDIVPATCDNIIERSKNVKELLYSVIQNEKEYLLTVQGETHTMGNLLMRAVLALYPDIPSVVYKADDNNDSMTLRIASHDDAVEIIENAIDHIIKIFTRIRTYF